ncbi:methylaspartate mutase [Streptomyces sp. NBC_01006]|uniref:methylaspartate mutase n=1 Tax=Streptomyces sp. NBC_01006 TaxID=2903716 RepID=UPI002F9161E2|nr:methylaspartate mutase [Streptomyces sp. NBC_01006]
MTGPAAAGTGRFAAHVRRARESGSLVVQPRMGFAGARRMREGLRAVRDVAAPTAGTVTVDSYTRVGEYARALEALRYGAELNGFPLVAHGAEGTREVLKGLASASFPVQVRHGSALAGRLVATACAAGADATEGGPVSYCLPYGRVPLRDSVRAWAHCCELIAAREEPMHLETFGGGMLGQLCPPSVLVALSVLEALFFREHGVRSLSLSYAQQTHPGQDLEALAALHRLAAERLDGGPDGTVGPDWHVVLYTFMGVFPRSAAGAFRLLEESARLAVRGGAARLVVKTPAEAHRIPTLDENVAALEFAAAVAADERGRTRTRPVAVPGLFGVYEEAALLVDCVLEQAPTVGEALLRSFATGLLDVPYCLHPDNANRARAVVDPWGALRWADPGRVPLPRRARRGAAAAADAAVGSRQLLDMLGFNERRFDAEDVLGRRLGDGAAA